MQYSSTTRPHTGNHTSTHFRSTNPNPPPRIIFSRLTQGKYHQITRRNLAYLQINSSGLFSYTRIIQVPGCTVTRSADQHRPCFHTRPGSKFTHLQFCSRLIIITGKSLFPRPKSMILSGKLFSRWPIKNCKLLNGEETSFRRPLISNNCDLCIRENCG